MKFFFIFAFFAAVCIATSDHLSKQDGIKDHYWTLVTAIFTGASAAAVLIVSILLLLTREKERASQSTMPYPTIVICLWNLDIALEATAELIRRGIPETHIFSCIDAAIARKKLSGTLRQILIISAHDQAEVGAPPQTRFVLPIANRKHLLESMENIIARFRSLGFSNVIPVASAPAAPAAIAA